MTQRTEFQTAAQRKPPGLAAQFFSFLVENKKWWLLPIVLVLAAFGGLVLLAGTGAAPFVYTMF